MELEEKDRNMCRSEIIGVSPETAKGEERICKEKLISELRV
jgi:hypothetical protein